VGQREPQAKSFFLNIFIDRHISMENLKQSKMSQNLNIHQKGTYWILIRV